MRGVDLFNLKQYIPQKDVRMLILSMLSYSDHVCYVLAYCESLKRKKLPDLFFLDCAERGYINRLKQYLDDEHKSMRDLTKLAAQFGHFEMMKELLSLGCNYRFLHVGAARGAQLNILKWAKRTGLHFDCGWRVFESAALSGDVDTLTWVDANMLFYKVCIHPEIILELRHLGHFNVLNWIINNNYYEYIPKDFFLCGKDDSSLDFNMIRGLHKEGLNLAKLPAFVGILIAESGDINRMDWILDQGYLNRTRDPDNMIAGMIRAAARKKDFRMIQRLHTVPNMILFDWDMTSIYESAIEIDDLELVKFLREELNYFWDERVFIYAAEYACIEIMDYLVKNGCPTDYRACSVICMQRTHVSEQDLVKSLKWCIEHGIEWREESCKHYAELHGLRKIRAFLDHLESLPEEEKGNVNYMRKKRKV